MKYIYVCDSCGEERNKIEYGGMESDIEPLPINDTHCVKYMTCKSCLDDEEKYDNSLSTPE